MSQQQQQLSGAVAILALSIATLAAVLAGVDRGRSRRDARGHCCRPCAPAVVRGADACACAARSPAQASTAAAPSAAGPGTGVEGGEERSVAVGPRTQPGCADGRAPDPPGLPGRRLEILVHNISHKDMVLSLRRTRSAVKPARPQQRPTGEAVSDVIDAVDTALARPKFSLFKRSSELILKKLLDIRAAGGSEPPPAVCPVHRRGEPELWSDTPAPPRESVSVGFDLDETPIPISDLAGYRVRSEDVDRLAAPAADAGRGDAAAAAAAGSLQLPRGMNRRDSSGLFMVSRAGGGGGGGAGGGGVGSSPSHVPGRQQQQQQRLRLQRLMEMESKSGGGGGGSDETGPGAEGGSGGSDESQDGEAYITGVYFPLLSVLMPKWLEQLDGNGEGADASQKTVLLVSGVGQPRNEEHRLEDNSTEVTAVLMEAFLRRHFPDVRVVRVHSDTNIFRYDDNIRFVKTELLPLLNAERSRMAEKYGGDWQDMMHITMSFADGSPARISSINTALRHFKPSFIHIWELKTFWHEKIICEDDVEVHTFEDIDMQPPIPASEVDAPTGMVIAEMLRLRDDLERIVAAPPTGGVVGGDTRDDLASFWLRKTKRPVLAVLLVQKKGGPPLLYRGTNMEVSMPTGSLCAERNVIGSALTADLSLLRRDIKAVAVLSVARLGRSSSSASASAAAAAAGAPRSAAAVTSGPGCSSFGPAADGGERSGRGGWGPRSGLGSGLGSVGTSVVGSSVASRVPSPLTLTPAMKASPKRASAGAEGREEGRAGGAGTAAAEDEKRLEGVRQALFAVEAETAASARRPPAAAAAAVETTPTRPRISEFFRRSPDCRSPAGKRSDDSNGGGGHGHDGIHGDKNSMDGNSDSAVDSRGGTSRQQEQQQQAQRGSASSSRADARLRSESCTDELLAAGRVKNEETFGSSPGVDGAEGEGPLSSAPGRTVAQSGMPGGEGPGDAGPPAGRSNVPRSQSLDLGVAEGGRASRRDSSLVQEEDLSRRKILRGTKVVRSITSTPKRAGGSGSIIGADVVSGDWTGAANQDGGGGRGDDRGIYGNGAWNNSTRGGGGGGRGKAKKSKNRSSIVAHVPAETLCSNPLKPCGACMEWLKKIAEVNPDFKVITFTDSRCGGVYIEDVAQIL